MIDNWREMCEDQSLTILALRERVKELEAEVERLNCRPKTLAETMQELDDAMSKMEEIDSRTKR